VPMRSAVVWSQWHRTASRVSNFHCELIKARISLFCSTPDLIAHLISLHT